MDIDYGSDYSYEQHSNGNPPVQIEWKDVKYEMPAKAWGVALDRGDIRILLMPLKITQLKGGGIRKSYHSVTEIDGIWLGRWISEHPECCVA